MPSPGFVIQPLSEISKQVKKNRTDGMSTKTWHPQSRQVSVVIYTKWALGQKAVGPRPALVPVLACPHADASTAEVPTSPLLRGVGYMFSQVLQP